MTTILKTVYAPVPLPTKAQSFHLGDDPKGSNILYCVGNSVVIRNIKDLTIAELYQQHSYPPTTARYAPSGYYIASADNLGKIRIWDTTQSEHILKNEFHLLSGAVLDMCWTSDSKRIAVVGQGKEKFGAVILADSGASVGEITAHTKTVNSVDIRKVTPYRLVTCSEDFSANYFEGPPFRFKKSHKEHSKFVNSVRFSPNGDVFITVSSDKRGLVYDGKTGERLGELDSLNGHKMSIMGIAWSPDSSKFLTVSTDKTAKIWDYSTRKVIKTIEVNDDQLLGCLWYGSNVVAISLTGFLHLLDPEAGTVINTIYGHNRLITSLVIDQASRKVYSGDFAARVLQWDVDKGSALPFKGKPHLSQVTALRLHNGNIYSISIDDTIKVSPINDLTWGTSVPLEFQPLAFDVDPKTGNSIIVGESIVAVVSGSQITRHSVPYRALCAAVSPDGSEVAIGGKDYKIYVYSLSGTKITQSHVFGENRGEVLTLSYSPNGKYLAAGDGNREVIVWEGQTRKVTGWVFHTTRINQVSWSPDSVHIASAGTDANLIIWNINDPTKRIIHKNAHYGGVNQVSWLDNESIISGGQDCSLKLFNIKF